jgi:hypothetical protein
VKENIDASSKFSSFDITSPYRAEVFDVSNELRAGSIQIPVRKVAVNTRALARREVG